MIMIITIDKLNFQKMYKKKKFILFFFPFYITSAYNLRIKIFKMQSPSNSSEGGIKNTSDTDTIIINTGIFNYSMVIQNVESKNNYNNNIKLSYNNKEFNLNDEENNSEITEVANTEIESSSKISPGITEVDETEERDFPEVESQNEVEKETTSEVKLNEEPLKVEIVEVDKVNLLTNEIGRDEKENASSDTKIILNTGSYDYSILVHIPDSQIQEIEEEKEEKEEKEENEEEKEENEEEKEEEIIEEKEEEIIKEKEEEIVEEIIEEKEEEIVEEIIEEKEEEKEKEIVEEIIEENENFENDEENVSDYDKSHIPIIKSDKGLWWIFSKPQSEIESFEDEKETENVNDVIDTDGYAYSNLDEEYENQINEIKNEEIKTSACIEYQQSENTRTEIDTETSYNYKENSSPTTVYIIVTCSEDRSLDKEDIKMIPKNENNIIILDSELDIIKLENQNFYNENYLKDFKCDNIVLNSIEGKNVYLYKLNIVLNNNKESFKLKLFNNGKPTSESSSYDINKGQQLFITYKSKKNWYNNILFQFGHSPNNKYTLSNLQYFEIFLYHFIFNKKENYIPSLLRQYVEEINKNEKLDFEFLFEFFYNIININKRYLNVIENINEIIKSIILNLKNKKDIMNVKKIYNKEKYNEILKLLEKLETNFTENEEQNLYYNLFLLIIINLNNEHVKFNEIFEKIQLKEEAVQYIIHHKNCFPNLQYSNLKLLFENATNKNKFNNILSLATDYNEYLKFFCHNADYIFNEKTKITFEKIPEPNENTGINLLNLCIEIIIRITDNLEKKWIEEFYNSIYKLIDTLNKKDLMKLYELKEISKKHLNFKEIMNRINYAIHITGKEYILKNKLNNLEIINFIHEDAMNYPNSYKNNDYLKLIEHINLDEIDDEFCYKFNTSNGYFYDYAKLFDKNYIYFINSIIRCAKNFKQFENLLKIFDIEYKIEYKDIKKNERPTKQICKIIELLVDRINELDKNNITTEELGEIFGPLFKLISDYNNHSLNTILKNIKKRFSSKEINEIYSVILANQNGFLNENVVKKLVENMDELTSDNIISYLNYFENEKIKNFFLQKLDKKIVSEEEIFDEKLSDNLKILRASINMKYFDEDNNEAPNEVIYIKKTRENMNNLVDELSQYEFSMKQLQSMYTINNDIDINDENNLKNRLCIISLGNEPLADDLYQRLNEKINNCIEIFRKIDEIINNIGYYYQNDKRDKIEFYKRLRDEIIERKINMFPDMSQPGLSDFKDLYDEAHEISRLKTSKFFTELYEKNKKNSFNTSDTSIMETVKKEFFDLKKIFNLDTEDEIDTEEIIIHINNSEIEEEVERLIEIFQIQEPPNNNICEKLKILNVKKNTITVLNNIKMLLKYFKLKKKSNFYYNINIIINCLKQKHSLTMLYKYYKALNRLGLDILNSDDYLEFQAVINEMFSKPELMNFIIDKKIEDIHQMGEFIDDVEDIFITLADINKLESCIAFIQEVKKLKLNDLNGRKFINDFNDIVKREEFKDIGITFKDVSGKYSDFNELYTNHLNPNELNKVHIELVYKKSEFNIQYSYPEYTCKVEYKSKDEKEYSKDFDEMLDLKDVALLRKKDQKEEYFKICDGFAEIISDIQEILRNLNIISSKGYFEEINYIIFVNNGDAYGYYSNGNDINDNGKLLKEIINELKDIIELQDKEVKETYSYYPITRMIFGRQFSILYNSINRINIQNKNKSSNIILNNILKYITNNKLKHKFSGIINKNNTTNNDLKEMFKSVNYYLNMLFNMNIINLESIFKNAIILDESISGLYTHSCSVEAIEYEAIQCSINLTGNFPLAQTVLYCNDNVSEDELISFIYKSIKCDLHALFILIKPEKLTIEMKNLLIKLLQEHYSLKDMKSCLLILYTNENQTTEVITEIEKISYNKYFDTKKKEKNGDEVKKFPDVEIYSSEFSGLGKSTLIKNNFKKELGDNYEYVYFPIGDDINKDEIIQRLLELTDKNIGLHLDLYNSNNIELIREFFFMFLILKCYSKDEKIFFYGNEIKIKVEIPNSFIDYMSLFPIFSFFNNIKIKSNNLPKLIVPNDITSNVQIVCNYLRNIDFLNEKDIYIEGISKSEFDSKHQIKAIQLSQKECKNLIFEYLNIENPNYYQISSFINIVSEQLKLLTNSCYLNIEQLNFINSYKRNSNLNIIRKFFVESLVKITKHFITSSYDNIIKGQNVTFEQQKGKIDLEKANKEANELLINKIPFSINQIRPSMILINEDGQSISEIVTCDSGTNEYNLLKAMYNSDSISVSRNIIDYKNLSQTEYMKEVRKVLNLYNKIDRNEKDFTDTLDGKKLKYIKDIVNSYVFTEDNFTKLLLISLRLRTNVPVVMMGETGCGKTSLIKIIAELKGIPMEILNIHAGIEDKDIIKFLKERNLFENDDHNEVSKNEENNNQDIWVFLDEINTCNSLGLITEIMLKHSCQGKKLKKNIKFIAACNPYRLDTEEKEIVGLYDEAKHLNRKLVYNVNPLPHSLLNFVFDFKTPEKEDIKRYISNIVSKTFKELPLDAELLPSQKIEDTAINSLFNAHEFIKTQYDISSVSLREIRRWQILFKWFIKLLTTPYFKEKFSFKNDSIYLYSLNLSIYLCYYMRIFSKKKRSLFLNEVKKSFDEDFEFESFPKKVQEIIADETELDKGIAKNRPILENLFAIFVCLNTRIPLFIVGKPGCSKTLSAQLIFKSMKGKDSSNELFKNFPKIYTKSYQGSLNSNSAGIEKIFSKARNSLKDKNLSNEIISAIYFDEMGLAEISNNNPLKVIHSELEYDDNDEKVSFIGISNWPLDASKMNRGIYLSIPEPDEEDLISTAIAIAESYDSRLKQNYHQYLCHLANSYFEYKIQMKDFHYKFESAEHTSVLDSKNNVKNINEFHGTRDFYHLIKTFSKILIKKKFPSDDETILKALNRSIESNFGGLEYSVKIFKEIIQKSIPENRAVKEYNVMECIKNNIHFPKSRYLLLITNSQSNQFLISFILNKYEKNQVFYYGSKFEDDISKGHYSAKVLNKIQVTMSNDNVMVLKNLDSLYPSLYDFFNQNFRVIGESEYARIALGNSNTQNYYVNKNLKCIILLDKNNIWNQDPPFLNRFEKHIISFGYLLNKNQKGIAKEMFKLVNKMIKVKDNMSLKIDLKYQLLNCSIEEFQGLIYQISNSVSNDTKNNNLNQIEFYKEKIFQKIVSNFSQDIIFYAVNSSFAQKYKEDFETILSIYQREERQHQNIKSYLESIEFNENVHIIYTFSNMLESVFRDKNETILNATYGKFTDANTENLFVNHYTSERDIEGKIFDFFNKEKHNLCILHFDYHDCIHLSHINYLISNTKSSLKESEKISHKKIILFIIHLKRVSSNNDTRNTSFNKKISEFNENLISHLAENKQCFIDNLRGNNIHLSEIYEASNIDLFKNEKLINLEDELRKNLFHAFTHISYKEKINFSPIDKTEYIEKVCEFIYNNETYKNLIQNEIIMKIEKINENIIEKVFYDYSFEDNDVDFISIIIKYLKNIYLNILITTLIQFEEYNIFSTKLMNEEILNNEYFEEIYQNTINDFDKSYEKYSCSTNTRSIDLFLGVSYPCIISIFKGINQYIVELRNEYMENENCVRFELYEENDDYIEKKNLLENNLKTEFEKHYIGEIFKNEDFEDDTKSILIKLLFKDYIIYYLSKSNNNNIFENKNILIFFDALYEFFITETDNMENDQELNIKNLIGFILFIECYKDYIYSLCKYVNMMEQHFNNFQTNYISIISQKIFKCKNTNISCVNNLLFNLFESFIYCVLTQQEFNSSNMSTELLNEIESIFNEMTIINNELRLTLKQILYLNDLVLVTEFFKKNDISLKENLIPYIKLLKKENEHYLIRENNNKSMLKKLFKKDPMDEEFDFLKKFADIEKTDRKKHDDLIIKILNNKIKISKDEKYREKLINIICSNDSLIINSKTIFNLILKRFTLCPINRTNEIQENSSNNIVENSNSNEYDYINGEDGASENSYYDDNSDNSDFEYSDDEDDGFVFLSEFEKEKSNSIIKKINKTKNRSLDEVLLSLFDKEFLKYFDMKKSNETKIFSQSLEIFKKCVDYIEKEKAQIKNNNKIAILYCISYIKIYCYYLSETIHKDEKDELPIYEITDFLNSSSSSSSSSSFRNVIKIYILKLLNKLIINNYKEMIEFIKKKQLFYKDFNFSSKISSSLEYLFIDNGTFDNYKEIRKEYINNKNENFKTTKKMISLLKNGEDKIKSILNFYDLIMNEEISCIKNDFNTEQYDKITKYTTSIISNFELSPLSENILNIYYDSNSVKKEMPYIRSLSLSNFEMLLYSHKLAFICSLSKNNSVYSNILSPNVLNYLRNIYIPGGEPNDNLLIISGDRINMEFENGTTDAIYICSCYYYYRINGCGFPMRTFNCINCGKLIGGNDHKLVSRPGHVRIYLNESEILNNDYINRYHFYVPYMYLAELMRKVEDERKKQLKGFKKVNKDFFTDNNLKKKVRNISTVTYRVLSFIFYSCIYYNCYLSSEDLKRFYYSDSDENTSILSIMEDIWESLSKELKNRGIDNTKCFLNLIIPELSILITNNRKGLQKPEERDEFETLCNNVIEDIIKNYSNSKNIYIGNNNNILEIKDDTIESILQETSDPNKLSKKNMYPLINYYNLTKYPNKKDFEDQFKLIKNRINMYPVTTKYLNALSGEENDIGCISEIFNMLNPLVTYVLSKYDNKISRKDAKETKIEDELKTDPYMEKLFLSFQKGWELIYEKLPNYDCNGNLPIKKINEQDCLVYILNDKIERGYGQYIATAYKTIITCQNTFLNSLISDNTRIIIQKANHNEIVSLAIENDDYDSLEDVLCTFTNRNSYDGNIKYDFDAIEVVLSKLLLSGKKLLKEEQEQIFINYAFEVFNQDETIITRYKDKIKNDTLLTKEEISRFTRKIRSIDYKIIIINLQSLFLYFINKKNITGEELLSEEIRNIPENLFKLDDEFRNLFLNRNNELDLQLNKLIDFYELVEYINFDKILQNVPKNHNYSDEEFESLHLNEYINAYNELENSQINKLNQHFENKNNNLLIHKKDLRDAIRKFISRNMVSERFNDFNSNIFDKIKYKEELWKNKIISEENQTQFYNEIKELEDLNIKIGQIIDLYKKLKSENINQNKHQRKSINKNKIGKRSLGY